MNNSTINIIAAALKADSTVDKEHLARFLDLCRNGNVTNASGSIKKHIPRVIPRAEVAGILGVSKCRVDQLARMGLLNRVKAGGLSRALGYSEESVIALAEGRG